MSHLIDRTGARFAARQATEIVIDSFVCSGGSPPIAHRLTSPSARVFPHLCFPFDPRRFQFAEPRPINLYEWWVKQS